VAVKVVVLFSCEISLGPLEEASRNISVLHLNYTAKEIRFMFSQKWNCESDFYISQPELPFFAEK
jgi:hypothetical protein